jgi:hypothetical protein
VFIIWIRSMTLMGFWRSTLGVMLPAAAIMGVTFVAAIWPSMQGLLLTSLALACFVAAMLLMPKIKVALVNENLGLRLAEAMAEQADTLELAMERQTDRVDKEDTAVQRKQTRPPHLQPEMRLLTQIVAAAMEELERFMEMVVKEVRRTPSHQQHPVPEMLLHLQGFTAVSQEMDWELEMVV